MYQAEINSKVSLSPANNLVVTGIVDGKRCSVFTGNAFQLGDVIDGLANVEPNKNPIGQGKNPIPQYNFVSMVSDKAISSKIGQFNLSSAKKRSSVLENMTEEQIVASMTI